jgi:hypothetical protein
MPFLHFWCLLACLPFLVVHSFAAPSYGHTICGIEVVVVTDISVSCNIPDACSTVTEVLSTMQRPIYDSPWQDGIPCYACVYGTLPIPNFMTVTTVGSDALFPLIRHILFHWHSDGFDLNWEHWLDSFVCVNSVTLLHDARTYPNIYPEDVQHLRRNDRHNRNCARAEARRN